MKTDGTGPLFFGIGPRTPATAGPSCALAS